MLSGQKQGLDPKRIQVKVNNEIVNTIKPGGIA